MVIVCTRFKILGNWISRGKRAFDCNKEPFQFINMKKERAFLRAKSLSVKGLDCERS